MISSILFDFGGTLDADGGHWLDRTYHVYNQIGMANVDKTAVKEAFYYADAQAEKDPAMRSALYRNMMEKHFHWQFQRLSLLKPDKEAEAVTVFVRAAERVLRRNRKTLETLSLAGFRMGVVSNFYGNIETLCREFGFNPFLQVLIDSAVEGVSKPDPKIYSLALERLKRPAGQVLMVGDNFDRDILPAKALGMKTAWLIGGQKRTPPDPTKVDLILRSVEELPDRIKSLQKDVILSASEGSRPGRSRQDSSAAPQNDTVTNE
jgi:putative hydrolase of the HAD superfamily